MATYWVNDQVIATATFATTAGVATNPTTVTFKVAAPAGTTTSYVYGAASEVERTTTGTYTCTFTADAAGTWQVAAIGTGTVARSDVDKIRVYQRPGDQ